MQYIKHLISYYLPSWSEQKQIELKDYQKLKVIGHGGFGNVFLVQKGENLFAAKVSKLTADEPQEFLRELEILIKIQHPAILPFEGYSVNDFSGDPFPTILTKYASNGSLRDMLSLERMSRAPNEWNDTIKYIVLYGIAKGMDFMHKKHFIHRDLKPENILLDDYLYPLISDFGLSKFFKQEEMSQQTQNTGTIFYMAPEVIDNKRYDLSVDVYSYGLMMYEVITGLVLYPEIKQELMLPQKVLDGYRPKFPNNYYVNEDIQNLIERCWSGDPTERPTFEEIVEILENEELIKSMNVDNDIFNLYLDAVNEPKSSYTSVHQITENYIRRSCTSSIRKVDLRIKIDETNSSSIHSFRRKVIEEDEPVEIKLYPASQLVFLDSNCQNLVRSAERGDSNMMVAVADSLIKGTHGFPSDIEIGIKYLKKAVELNNIEAIELYASMLIKGDVIPSDIEKAEPMVQTLLSKNCPNAQIMWAQIELTKPNPDYSKIKDNLKKSASDGNTEAMVQYGKFCLMKKEQTQIEPNEEEAMKFFNLAAKSGNQDAKKIMDDYTKEKEEEKRRQKDEEERRIRDEEERRRRDEEERRIRDEEERRRDEERRWREEEERKKREEEERRWREANMARYFPRPNINSGSIVDSLKSIGVDSSFGNRNRIANRNGIGNYSGSSSQNIHLLSLLKNGQLIQP